MVASCTGPRWRGMPVMVVGAKAYGRQTMVHQTLCSNCTEPVTCKHVTRGSIAVPPYIQPIMARTKQTARDSTGGIASAASWAGTRRRNPKRTYGAAESKPPQTFANNVGPWVASNQLEPSNNNDVWAEPYEAVRLLTPTCFPGILTWTTAFAMPSPTKPPLWSQP